MDTWGDTSAADPWGSTGNSWGDANNNAPPKDNACRRCKQEGHFAKDCPNSQGSDTCRKCNETGHFAKDCPNSQGSDTCRKCNETGHFAKDCPNSKPENCRKCGKEGHFARECSEPDKCKRCGEEGHMVKDCTQAETTRVIENEDGTKREIYVPSEIGQDDLFKQNINTGINFDKYDEIPVKTNGADVPKPISSFEEAELRTILLDNVKKSGYSKPTPIQRFGIPGIMSGRDIMGCAQTGSGKTAAFLLPILSKLLASECAASGGRPQKPEAVIVAPTRELAIQIKDEGRKFGHGSVLKSVVVYGGTSVGFQARSVESGCNVLIATVGRLMDFVEKGIVSFENVRFLVLDEADRMLDMGFRGEIDRIVKASGMPPKGKRQTLMFSATFPMEIRSMAEQYLENYILYEVGMVGGACSDVEQVFLQVPKFDKRAKLLEILTSQDPQTKTMIFVERKKTTDFLASFLSQEGLLATSIHGDRFQREREEALAQFKSGRMPIIVCTAVAARGLDIKGVAHVINYDLPNTGGVDEYVHRIGRTGRVGNIGKATSFFDPDTDSQLLSDLKRVLGDAHQVVPDFMNGGGDGFGGATEEVW